MVFDSNQVPIVIDNGSGFIKAGYAGQDKPTVSLRTMVGHPKHTIVLHHHQVLRDSSRPYIVGNELTVRRGVHKLHWPMDNGVVTNWFQMNSLYEHLFYSELNATPSDHPILITEAFHNPPSYRGKLAEVLFETFHCPALFVSYQSLLALYAAGKVNGLIIDSGESLTCIVPVIDTFDIRPCILRQNLAGKHITHHLVRLLTECGVRLISSAEYEIAREIKERYCFISADYETSIQASTAIQECRLPDGQIVRLNKELFRAPEILFNPYHIGAQYMGLTPLIMNTFARCDMNVRGVLAENILLTGGSTLFEGFTERLIKELKCLIPEKVNLNVSEPFDRELQNWIGGSIIASLNSFPDMCVTNEEYHELGPDVMRKKIP